MDVIITIEDREAIPVRAIPFITGWVMSPDNIAASLANNDFSKKFQHLFAYHLSSDGHPARLLPREWDTFDADLEIFFSQETNGEVSQQERAIRRLQSIKLLPPGTFVWKDEFEQGFTRFYSSDNQVRPEERPGDRELNFFPYVPRELEEVVMNGFSKSQEVVTRQWPWGDYETPLLRILSAAVSRWCLSEEYPQKKTGEVQDWIKAEMRKASIPVSDSLIDHIETIISPRSYSHTRQRVKRKD